MNNKMRDPDYYGKKMNKETIRLRTGAWAVNGISKSTSDEPKGKHSVV